MSHPDVSDHLGQVGLSYIQSSFYFLYCIVTFVASLTLFMFVFYFLAFVETSFYNAFDIFNVLWKAHDINTNISP